MGFNEWAKCGIKFAARNEVTLWQCLGFFVIFLL